LNQKYKFQDVFDFLYFYQNLNDVLSNPQSTGHIFLSTFAVEVPGNYKATGILVTGNKTIASVNFVVNQ